MLRFPTWKIAVVLAVCLAGVAFSLPNLFPRAEMERMPDWLPHQQINLGLDLQGGSHLLLEVNLNCNLWSEKVFGRAAVAAGFSQADLIETIVAESMIRQLVGFARKDAA